MLPVALEKNNPMTNLLRVPFLKEAQSDTPVEELSALLDKEQKHVLAFAPWKTFPYRPRVGFAVAHGKDCLLLKYYVEEAFVSAVHSAINAPVYEDSCVEFFISFDQAGYYNFEFNCLGACLAAFGPARDSRGFLPEESIGRVRSQSVINRNDRAGGVQWTITLVIPLSVFVFHSLATLDGVKARSNFYKCGDALPEPHYLAWADIESPEPDFHLPQFFGNLIFQKAME